MKVIIFLQRFEPDIIVRQTCRSSLYPQFNYIISNFRLSYYSLPPKQIEKTKMKQTAPAYIVNTSNFGRCKFGVVAPTTGRVYPSTCDPLLQYGIFNCKVEHLVDFSSLILKHLIELYPIQRIIREVNFEDIYITAKSKVQESGLKSRETWILHYYMTNKRAKPFLLERRSLENHPK